MFLLCRSGTLCRPAQYRRTLHWLADGKLRVAIASGPDMSVQDQGRYRWSGDLDSRDSESRNRVARDELDTLSRARANGPCLSRSRSTTPRQRGETLFERRFGATVQADRTSDRIRMEAAIPASRRG